MQQTTAVGEPEKSPHTSIKFSYSSKFTQKNLTFNVYSQQIKMRVHVNKQSHSNNNTP